MIYFAFGELINYDPLAEQFGDENVPRMEETMAFIERAVRWMVGNLNNLLFLMVLGIDMIYKVAHSKRQTLAEFLVLGFYITGSYILVGMIDPILWLFGAEVRAVKVIFFFGYFTYAYVSYLEKVSFWTILKGLLMGVFSWFFYFLTAIGFSSLVVLLFDL